MNDKVTNTPKVSDIILKHEKIPDDVMFAQEYLHEIFRGTLNKLDIPFKEFGEYLNQLLKKNGTSEEQLNGGEFKKGEFIIDLKNGQTLGFSLENVQEYIAPKIMPADEKKKSEEKIARILEAIEYIYKDNDKLLWDGEINDEDRIKTTAFDIHGMSLKNETLSGLRQLMEIEKEKVFQIYDINGNTHAKQKLLKEEIKLFAGIGGIYEGGARYFSLSESEIDRKVSGLISTMGSNQEIFEYIKATNKNIRKNRKKSDMVTQVNGKVIDALYQQTFQKLKNENAPNKDFIECCKIITGRGEINGNKDGFSYEKLTMEESMKDYQIANEIVIHLMMKPNGVFDSMKKDFIVQDPEIENHESPDTIISHSMAVLSTLGAKMPEPKTAQQLLKDMRIPDVGKITGKYEELGFNEKVSLGALVRIVNIIESMGYEDAINKPKKFQTKLMNASQNSFKDINKSLSDNFDGTNIDMSMGKSWLSWFNMNVGGLDANEMGLSGEFGEIFNLYQDMNGNSGFFDWSDETKDFLSPSLAGMATLTASLVIFAAAVALAPATVSGIVIAGMVAGAGTGLTTSILSSQGFDTPEEAFTNTALTVAVDGALGAFFFFKGNKYVMKKGFASLKDVPFFTTTNAKEMLKYGGGEMLANMWLVAPIMGAISKNKFDENHFDTNNFKYKDGKKIPRRIVNTETKSDEASIQEPEHIEKASIEILPLIAFKDSLENKPFKFSEFKGDKEAVKSLQSFLSIEADGQFGQITYEAVKNFQSHNNDVEGNPLQVDGMPGEKTLSAMIKSQNDGLNNNLS